jgi:hypothetical protein
MQLTVATCQFPVDADVRRNLQYIARHIRTAQDRGAHVAHFPEACLSGYAGVDFPSYNAVEPRPIAGATQERTLSGAAHRERSGAPFNGARDCSQRELYMDNGIRTRQRASGVGNSWGPKPVKKRAAVAQPRVADRPSPATYADARNLCMKRREAGGVKCG